MQEMGRNMLDIILDTLLDSVKLLPFLFITYLLMEELEHKTGGKAKNRIRSAGKSGRRDTSLYAGKKTSHRKSRRRRFLKDKGS